VRDSRGLVVAVLSVLWLAPACGGGKRGPSKEQKARFTTAVAALSDTRPEDRLAKLLRVCAGIPACAAGCGAQMNAWIDSNPAERMGKMSGCAPLVERYPEGASTAQIDRYWWARLKKFGHGLGVEVPLPAK
jgi:hypothetical protein